MARPRDRIKSLSVEPLTLDRWGDFTELFGKCGACGGCWCMWWRIRRSEFEQKKGDANKRAMKVIVRSGKVPGLLGYDGGEPVAWCSVAPREHFPVLARSRILRPLDDAPVWSVVCFFIRKSHRNRGVTRLMLRAAVDYVRRQGGKVVEGYPVAPKKEMPPAFAWTGLASSFESAGFEECARRSETRPIMRYYIGRRPRGRSTKS